MKVFAWLRRHRVWAAFVGGALLALMAVAVAGYLVLSDQRRSARLLSVALSRALAREVRIERVTDLGTHRAALRGVRLPRDGGWPVEVTAERVEATGPLLAAARGDEAPVRLVVTRPTVTTGGGTIFGLTALDDLGASLLGFLSGAPRLDVTLTGGVLAQAGGPAPLEFELTIRTGRGEAHAELGADRRG